MYASDPIIFLLSNNFQPFPHDGSAGNKFLQLLFEKVFFARSLLKGNFAAYRILPTEVLHAPLFTSMVSEEKFNVFFPLLLSRSPPHSQPCSLKVSLRLGLCAARVDTLRCRVWHLSAQAPVSFLDLWLGVRDEFCKIPGHDCKYVLFLSLSVAQLLPFVHTPAFCVCPVGLGILFCFCVLFFSLYFSVWKVSKTPFWPRGSVFSRVQAGEPIGGQGHFCSRPVF